MNDGKFNSKKTNRFPGHLIGSSQSTNRIVLSDLSGIQIISHSQRKVVGTRKLWLGVVWTMVGTIQRRPINLQVFGLAPVKALIG